MEESEESRSIMNIFWSDCNGFGSAWGRLLEILWLFKGMLVDISLFWAIGVGENGDLDWDEAGKGDGVPLGDCIRPGDWVQAWGDDEEDDDDDCRGFAFE